MSWPDVKLIPQTNKLDKKRPPLECTHVENQQHLVKDKENFYLVTLNNDSFSCTCTFYISQRMVCKHGFYCIEKHGLQFTQGWVLSRWLKPHLKRLASETGGMPKLPKEKSPTNPDEKYSHTKKLADEFIRVATNKDPSTYMEMMHQLRMITVGHAEDIEVHVQLLREEPLDLNLPRKSHPKEKGQSNETEERKGKGKKVEQVDGKSTQSKGRYAHSKGTEKAVEDDCGAVKAEVEDNVDCLDEEDVEDNESEHNDGAGSAFDDGEEAVAD